MEWSAFWTFIILTTAFAYFRDAHVRVDLIRERLPAKAQAVIVIAGFFVLLAPICLIVMWFGVDYVGRSYVDEEPSGALLGSPTGFLFKAMLPIGFLLLLLAGATVTLRNLRLLKGVHRKVNALWENRNLPLFPGQALVGDGVEHLELLRVQPLLRPEGNFHQITFLHVDEDVPVLVAQAIQHIGVDVYP